MNNTNSYKNRKNEINKLIDEVMCKQSNIVLYHSHSGYGNTAFISRILYMLHETKSMQLFSAELSKGTISPIHQLIKSIVRENDVLYQRMQLFTDENLGEYKNPLFPAFIKDITQSEAIASLFQGKEALPVYAGYYQDRLKDVFFKLINNIATQKKVVVFIDNIQFLDNESIYDLKALLGNLNLKLVLFKTGESDCFDKFYYETNGRYMYTEINFPAPDKSYVKVLGEIYRKTVNENEAIEILQESGKDIRKILYLLRKPESRALKDTERQILNIIALYNDYISPAELKSIINYSVYRNIFSIDDIENMCKALEKHDYFQSIIDIATKQTKYKIVNGVSLNLDIADQMVFKKNILEYYSNLELDYNQLRQAINYADDINEENIKQALSLDIVKLSLRMGYDVDDDITKYLASKTEPEIQLLIGVLLFSKSHFESAKKILEKYIKTNYYKRDANILYAITLNRCRDHQMAKIKLKALIATNRNIDELTILVSYLVSNCIHSNKNSEGVLLFNKYEPLLRKSTKYPYFLRSSAILFDAEEAFKLRDLAKTLFKENEDFFGYYSTIINMTPYYISHREPEYAINHILMAYDGLQQFSGKQIHLAANNLGICYLIKEDYINAIKYLELAKNSAETIMPKAYATINLSGVHLRFGKYTDAYTDLMSLSKEILSANLPRLKSRFFLQKALLEYAMNHFESAICDGQKALKYALTPAIKSKSTRVVNTIIQLVSDNINYQDAHWHELFLPCYLEYWTVNVIDILTDDFLSF